MPFVYTGKGKKGGTTENGSPPQCAKLACAIQWCLAKRNHKEKYCQVYIDEWKTCRDKYVALHRKEQQEQERGATPTTTVVSSTTKKPTKLTVSS
mmetsp:Transcript_14187/g.23498  ORF Transcript_14187/g.23498 Transcript_14187/m.23498 type:complete len:95 (-) Transcript_14187:248-532(-)